MHIVCKSQSLSAILEGNRKTVVHTAKPNTPRHAQTIKNTLNTSIMTKAGVISKVLNIKLFKI